MTALQGSAISGGKATAITAHATTAHTKGSWTQLIASTTADSTGVIVEIVGDTAGNWDFLVDIGIGASPTVLIPNLIYSPSSGQAAGCVYAYSFPLVVPSGSELSACCQCSTAAKVVNVHISLTYDSWGGVVPGTSISAYGADTADSGGTNLVYGTSPTEGAWTELVDPSSAAAVGFVLGVGRNRVSNVVDGREALIDIGTGASPSEVQLIGNHYMPSNADELYANATTPYLPVAIPTSTRIVARSMTLTATSNNVYEAVLYALEA